VGLAPAVATKHTREVFTNFADRLGTTIDSLLTGMANTPLLKQLPNLNDVTNFPTFSAYN
jgi:hypothetical protein